MIRHLRVQNFVLIEELELELDEGFWALTGETGAGKSVLARAVELLRGGRARAELVRAGAEEAVIEALLEPGPGSSAWPRLREAGLPEGDGQLVVRRVITRAGRGRVTMNGALATTAQLADVVGPLIDVTSQHEHQSLGEVRNHLEALDAFGRHGELRAAMTAAHQGLREAQSALEAAESGERTRAEREDFLRFQLQQIDGLAVREGEETALAAERDRLRAAERLGGAARRAEESLYAGEGAAADKVVQVLRELGPLVGLDPALGPLLGDLEAVRAELEDAAFRLRRYADQITADPARLAEIEDRLDALGVLLRKHGPTTGALLERRAEMAAELLALEHHLERREEARARLEAARGRAVAAASALTEARLGAKRTLTARVAAALADLQMGGARVEVRVEPVPVREGDPPALSAAGRRLGETGSDRVEFLLAANPGEPLAPLSRIASGGELSRIMLALKLVTADADAVATYVFDEVDAGIGGAVAETVGRLVRQVARHRQVFCVTHLAQIAACADVHLHVEKRERRGRTVQLVRRLDERAREAEVARMMAGVEVTDKARAHAAEMLRRVRG